MARLRWKSKPLAARGAWRLRRWSGSRRFRPRQRSRRRPRNRRLRRRLEEPPPLDPERSQPRRFAGRYNSEWILFCLSTPRLAFLLVLVCFCSRLAQERLASRRLAPASRFARTGITGLCAQPGNRVRFRVSSGPIGSCIAAILLADRGSKPCVGMGNSMQSASWPVS